jgi:glycosyltransferase involved in cell wall biosynthesis
MNTRRENELQYNELEMANQTSVVIPCYQVQDYLGDALQSVREQTAPVREIILIDDGSPDPVRVPEGWSGPPLRLLRTENRGLPAARNLGIAQASGEFVAFLDADDAWEPRKIERQEAVLNVCRDAVACYTRCVDQPGFFAFGPYPPADVSDAEFLRVLYYGMFFPPSSVMVRREVLNRLGGFHEGLGNGEDLELFVRLLTRGRFVQVPEPLCWYRQHAAQFTKNQYRKIMGTKQARAAIIAQHTDRLVQAGIPRHRLWDAHRNDTLLVYYRRDFAAARPLLWDYWKDHPHDWRVLAYAALTWLPPSLVARWRGRLSAASTVVHGGGEHGWQQALSRIP